MYEYGNYSDYSAYGSSSMSGILGFGIGTIIFSLVFVVLLFVSLWKIFVKAGKPGWAAIVPIYNMVVLLEIVELPMWYLVLFFIPIANLYASFKTYVELAHKFGKSTGFGVCLLFFSPICLPVLAFSSASYGNTYNNNVQMTNNQDMQPSTNGENKSMMDILSNDQNDTLNKVEDAPVVSPEVKEETPLENVQPIVEENIPKVEEVPVVSPEVKEETPLENVQPIVEENIPKVEEVPVVSPEVKEETPLENVQPIVEENIPKVEEVPVVTPEVKEETPLESMQPIVEENIPKVEEMSVVTPEVKEETPLESMQPVVEENINNNQNK